jgi:hypothetical protein
VTCEYSVATSSFRRFLRKWRRIGARHAWRQPRQKYSRKFDDLDKLAGTWTSQQVRSFERDTAAFSEVDPALWK